MTRSDTDVVLDLRNSLAARMGAERYDLWLGSGTELVLSDGVLRITAESTFQLDRLRKCALGEIRAVAEEVLGAETRFDLHVRDSTSSASMADAGLATVSREACTPQKANDSGVVPFRRPADSTGTGRRVLQRRRFAKLNTLVVGEHNKLAFTAAEMVLEDLGRFSPLLVYGPSGVGKTHILEGMWSEVRTRQRGLRVVYLTAEQFTTYFLQALKGTGLPSFRSKYRGVDLLIIDDVQFFARKQATIVELLHTMDALLRDGRQLVLAADRSPAELQQLGQEFHTRLAGGLKCEIKPLDRQTRHGVLLQLVAKRQMEISDGLLQRIAEHVTGDARQLSGVLNRLWVTSQTVNRPISRAMVDEVLGELFPSRSPVVRLADIEQAVCAEFAIEPDSLRSNQRGRSVSHPRMLAMWLARQYTRAALTEISEYFGRRSHSTVVSANKKVDAWVREGRAIQCARQNRDVRDVLQRLTHNLQVG